jgi:putative sterol carrier protein
MKEVFEVIFPSMMTAEKAKSINSVVQFKITSEDGGEWWMDFTRESDWVRPGLNPEAKCTLTVEGKAWREILLGRLDPVSAFFQQKLKLSGDLGLAMKMQVLLKAGQAEHPVTAGGPPSEDDIPSM